MSYTRVLVWHEQSSSADRGVIVTLLSYSLHRLLTVEFLEVDDATASWKYWLLTELVWCVRKSLQTTSINYSYVCVKWRNHEIKTAGLFTCLPFAGQDYHVVQRDNYRMQYELMRLTSNHLICHKIIKFNFPDAVTRILYLRTDHVLTS